MNQLKKRKNVLTSLTIIKMMLSKKYFPQSLINLYICINDTSTIQHWRLEI